MTVNKVQTLDDTVYYILMQIHEHLHIQQNIGIVYSMQ